MDSLTSDQVAIATLVLTGVVALANLVAALAAKRSADIAAREFRILPQPTVAVSWEKSVQSSSVPKPPSALEATMTLSPIGQIPVFLRRLVIHSASIVPRRRPYTPCHSIPVGRLLPLGDHYRINCTLRDASLPTNPFDILACGASGRPYLEIKTELTTSIPGGDPETWSVIHGLRTDGKIVAVSEPVPLAATQPSWWQRYKDWSDHIRREMGG